MLCFEKMFFYLLVALAITRYCSGVDRIPELIPAVIFLSCRRVDSLMFARSSVFPGEEHRHISETLSLFLDADVSDN